MTELQKAEALRLHAEGRIYKEIGEQIGATTESVKQFFYRNRKRKPQVRCGLEPEERYTHEDFMSVFDWNTPDAANTLGTAVSQISEQVLRQIEVTIKNYERSVEHERDSVSAERGLSDPGDHPGRTATAAPGQVRQTMMKAPPRLNWIRKRFLAPGSSTRALTIAMHQLPASSLLSLEPLVSCMYLHFCCLIQSS